jgi:hypothetical protein
MALSLRVKRDRLKKKSVDHEMRTEISFRSPQIAKFRVVYSQQLEVTELMPFKMGATDRTSAPLW